MWREKYLDYIANRTRAEKLGRMPCLPQVQIHRRCPRWWRRCSDTPEICGCPPSPCSVRMPPGSSMKMPNFRWYVVFHNESHHPHVHMVCYSAKPIVIREAVRLEELSAV